MVTTPAMERVNNLGALALLPDELVNTIVRLVDLEDGLAELAQTNHALLALCKPRLDFEELRVFDMDEPQLWLHLAVSRADARMARVLHVSATPEDTRQPVWLAGAQGPTMGAPLPQRLLGDAITHMENLRIFVWKASHASDWLGPNANHVWETLARACPRLEEIAVEGATGAPYSFVPEESKLFCLRSLKIVKLRMYGYQSSNPLPNLVTLAGFLNQSPHLATLEVNLWVDDERALSSVVPFNAAPLLDILRLPRLRNFTLGTAFCAPDVLARFLLTHPTLESLTLGDTPTHILDLSELKNACGALPNLTHCAWTCDAGVMVQAGLLNLSCIKAPLEHIEGIPASILQREIMQSGRLLDLLAPFCTLKVITVVFDGSEDSLQEIRDVVRRTRPGVVVRTRMADAS